MEETIDLQLRGKRALVTGASSGLGAAIALELAAEGVSVAVHGRDQARTEATARQAADLGVQSISVTGELMKGEDCERVADEALAALGQIDILVNNAGGVLRMDNPGWLGVTPEDWIDSFNLNVVAGVRLSQKLAPPMSERGWGRIINISSVAGSQPRGTLLDYAAPKAGVDNFTVNLSKLLGPTGVTVNAVCPGTIMTAAVERWLETLRKQNNWQGDFAEIERIYTSQSHPQSIPRLGRPREIAVAVVMLASPLSAYTNGAFIRVDGGMARHIGA